MMFVPCGTSEPDFKGFTLLMPAVSVGNVGQLAIDLIISTLNMCKVGYFYTDCLVPMVGNNPYATAEENSTELSINAEVYSLPSMNLMALQLRSIFIKYKSKAFCEKLISWVKRSKCAKVIVLSSSHSYHCDDEQLRSIPFRYLLTPKMEKSVGEVLQNLHWMEMEKSKSFPGIGDSELCIRIPGGGITKALYTESCAKEIEMAIILKFVSEGDNIPDAFDLVRYLNDWLQIIKPQKSRKRKNSFHFFILICSLQKTTKKTILILCLGARILFITGEHKFVLVIKSERKEEEKMTKTIETFLKSDFSRSL